MMSCKVMTSWVSIALDASLSSPQWGGRWVVIVSWNKFGSSWGLKPDWDASFTQLSRFMLVSWVKFGSCWGLIRFMWVSRDKFWSSWGLKQDLDDSFTFLSHFMLVFWDQFGSSWGLKPDLDDSFTFLRCFMKSETERRVLGRNALLIFWPKMVPNWSSKSS